MRLHVLALPHTETTSAYSFCAFTARTLDFCNMMTRAGHEVVLYGGEENEAEVAEFVPLRTRLERDIWWPNYVPHRDVFNDFDPNGLGWNSWNKRTVDALIPRIQVGDVICYTMGWSQHPVASDLPVQGIHHVEIGVGYKGTFAPFRVYESKAWRDYLLAMRHAQGLEQTDHVRFYDEVIPRAYDVGDFPLGDGDGGYFLFIGRLQNDKGPHIAAQACQRIGAKLLVAGQGADIVEPGKRIVCNDGTVLEGDVDWVGVVGPQERAELMGGAYATFVPTLYFEPFGGVSVESQLCGTPVMVTPSGGLPENVCGPSEVCRTMKEFAQAAETYPFLHPLDRSDTRNEAIARYSFEGVARQWDGYLARLADLSGAGWYA